MARTCTEDVWVLSKMEFALEEMKKYTPLKSSMNIVFQGHDLDTKQELITNWISKL